jgi:hypothetical protein
MAEDDTQPRLTAEMLAEAVGDRVSVGDAYRITTVVPYTEQPPETNEYIMPPQDMDEFFQLYHKTGEIVVDVRPVEAPQGVGGVEHP